MQTAEEAMSSRCQQIHHHALLQSNETVNISEGLIIYPMLMQNFLFRIILKTRQPHRGMTSN